MQKVFHYLTAETESESYSSAAGRAADAGDRLVALIARETAHAKAGRPAAIVAKMNGLLDRRMMEALYAASQAGVEIDLIVRGMCSLRPGVKGLSERIRVRSIVGRFLEHSRIFSFAQRRRGGGLLRQRGLDAAQPVRALRGGVSGDAARSAKRLRDEILGRIWRTT